MTTMTTPAKNGFRSKLLFYKRRAAQPPPADAGNVIRFLRGLASLASPAGQGAYAFVNADGKRHGFVQFIVCSPRELKIHRIWAIDPLQGHGTTMMKTLCSLADQHDVELSLKVLPIGRKPYPLSRPQLKKWYEQYGFAGPKWKMLRRPSVA